MKVSASTEKKKKNWSKFYECVAVGNVQEIFLCIEAFKRAVYDD